MPALPHSAIPGGGRRVGVGVISKSAFGAPSLWRTLLSDYQFDLRETQRMIHPHLSIAMGDPAGIGPGRPARSCDRRSLKNASTQLGRNSICPRPNLCFLQGDDEGEPIRSGVLSSNGCRFVFKAVEQGVARLSRTHRRYRERALE